MYANNPKYHIKRGILRKDSTSRIAGVNWYKPYSKWFVRIADNHKEIRLGYHADFFDARADDLFDDQLQRGLFNSVTIDQSL